jgi:hypothetical protein
VARNNVFGLLRHLGHETAGAPSFAAAGQVLAEQEPLRRHLPFEDLQARIDNRATEPFNRWDGKVRMSIAGHQGKLLVAIDDGELFLVDGALSSTHILKPEPARAAAPFMVANEHFCVQLANRISMRRWKSPCAAQVNRRVPGLANPQHPVDHRLNRLEPISFAHRHSDCCCRGSGHRCTSLAGAAAGNDATFLLGPNATLLFGGLHRSWMQLILC